MVARDDFMIIKENRKYSFIIEIEPDKFGKTEM